MNSNWTFSCDEFLALFVQTWFRCRQGKGWGDHVLRKRFLLEFLLERLHNGEFPANVYNRPYIANIWGTVPNSIFSWLLILFPYFLTITWYVNLYFLDSSSMVRRAGHRSWVDFFGLVKPRFGLSYHVEKCTVIYFGFFFTTLFFCNKTQTESFFSHDLFIKCVSDWVSWLAFRSSSVILVTHLFKISSSWLLYVSKSSSSNISIPLLIVFNNNRLFSISFL